VRTVRAIICAVLLGVPACAAASGGETLSARDRADLFAEATTVFAEGNRLRTSDAAQARQRYALAAALFERIAREGGVRNGKLYYNIGNAYFLQDRIGEAILNYRKAELLIPRHADLRENLRAARIQCRDQIETSSRRKVMEVLFFWHYDFSLFTRFVLFAICFASVWVLAGIAALKRSRGMRAPIVIASMLAATLAVSVAVQEYSLASTREGVILASEIVARKGDGESYSPGFKAPLHEGTEFILLGERESWLHIQLMDGRSCWIPRSSAGII